MLHDYSYRTRNLQKRADFTAKKSAPAPKVPAGQAVPTSRKNTTPTAAAAKKNAVRVLSGTSLTSTSTTTSDRPSRSRPLFAPVSLQSSIGDVQTLPDPATRSQTNAKSNGVASPDHVRAGNRTNASEVSQVQKELASSVVVVSEAELAEENRKFLQELRWYREMMAAGKPLAEVSKPAIPKDRPLRLAPSEVAIGLVPTSEADRDVNMLRIRMVSWQWDTIHDCILISKVEHKFGMGATYDDLKKDQVAAPVAMNKNYPKRRLIPGEKGYPEISSALADSRSH